MFPLLLESDWNLPEAVLVRHERGAPEGDRVTNSCFQKQIRDRLLAGSPMSRFYRVLFKTAGARPRPAGDGLIGVHSVLCFFSFVVS